MKTAHLDPPGGFAILPAKLNGHSFSITTLSLSIDAFERMKAGNLENLWDAKLYSLMLYLSELDLPT